MKVIKFLDRRLEEVILVLLLSCIVVIMLCQIVCRYVLNDSLSWSEEFCRYCYIWFMFVAFSYSIRFNLDLRVDAVLKLLPGALKKAVEIFGCFICLVLSAFLFYHSFGTVAAVLRTGETSVSLHLPMQYVYVASVIGYGLGTVRYVQKIIGMLLPSSNEQQTMEVEK